MAGGEGTRLRPLTSNAPKPMLPLANKPMMEHIIELLKRHGIEDIVVTVAFMANHIRTYFGDGSEFGVRMVYATEEQPLGTAGSVRNAMDVLDDNRNGRLDLGEMEGLSVWFDRNGNGVSDSGEVVPVSRLGIRAIATQHHQPEHHSCRRQLPGQFVAVDRRQHEQ